MNNTQLIPGTKVIFSVFPMFHQVSGVVTTDGQIEITDPNGRKMCEDQGVSLFATTDEVHEIHSIQ